MPDHEMFPREVTSDVPLLTLTGTERVHLEQHKGLITYQPDEIIFRTACGLLHITGEELCFHRYTASEAVIAGRISGIGLDGAGGRR